LKYFQLTLCQLVLTIRILPAVEGSEINNVPEIMILATLQENRQCKTDQGRAPSKQAILHIRWRFVATR